MKATINRVLRRTTATLFAVLGLSITVLGVGAVLALALPAPALAQDAAATGLEGVLGGIGLSGTAVAVILGVMRVLEIVGKAIPDGATGWLGWARRIAKFLSGYVTNKR